MHLLYQYYLDLFPSPLSLFTQTSLSPKHMFSSLLFPIHQLKQPEPAGLLWLGTLPPATTLSTYFLSQPSMCDWHSRFTVTIISPTHCILPWIHSITQLKMLLSELSLLSIWPWSIIFLVYFLVHLTVPSFCLRSCVCHLNRANNSHKVLGHKKSRSRSQLHRHFGEAIFMPHQRIRA